MFIRIKDPVTQSVSNDLDIKMSQKISTHLVSSLNERLTDIDSNDVILVSDDQIPFQAHRSIICASSLILKYLLLDKFTPTK